MTKAPFLTAAVLLTLASGLTAFAWSAPAQADTATADHIVAVVNTMPITLSEVSSRLDRIEAPVGSQLPPRAELARQVLDRLILEKAQIQWADEAGIKVDEAAVDEAELMVAQQNKLSLDQLRARLVQVGLTTASFRNNLRNELLLQRVHERMAGGAKVTEQDIDAYLTEQNGGKAATSQLLSLAQVLIKVPENADLAIQKSLQERASDVARRARTGADFAALAKDFSDSPEGKNGGQLGARPADRYPSLFTEATHNQAVGAVVGPIRSGAGWHILKVLERRNANLPASTVTQTRARHILLRATDQASQDAAVAQLQQLRQRIESGQAQFEDVAREHSVDGSARAGGDLGWAAPGQFVPEFEQVMNKLALQQVSAPVVSRFGVHLIQVQERRQTDISERDQREMVRNLLREQKGEQDFQEWLQDLRSRAYVEYRESPR